MHTLKSLFSLSWLKKRTERSENQLKATKPTSAIIYDCEIIKAIPSWDEELDPELEYCDGWQDFSNMGISVISAYDYYSDRYRIFLEDNFDEFQNLINSREAIIGFNSLSFDDNLCKANGLNIKTTYDLLSEVRVASGQPPHYVPGKTRAGYSLEQLSIANLGHGKSGTGALAPELWQRGNHGAVIDYALQDIQITRKLFDMRLNLTDPTNKSKLQLREDPNLDNQNVKPKFKYSKPEIKDNEEPDDIPF